MNPHQPNIANETRDLLVSLLSDDLDFHNESSSQFTHTLHAFPARFPPQLPRRFIETLTQPGDLVLDPMVGSGTTVLEAFLLGRRSIGIDIDPLTLRACQVKTTPLSAGAVAALSRQVLSAAQDRLRSGVPACHQVSRFDEKTRAFIDYWFSGAAQRELMALLGAIRAVDDALARRFFELVFSAIIITKSGGVSLAMDLAHTRPHRTSQKSYRSPLREFERRLQKNLESLARLPAGGDPVVLARGDARTLPLNDNLADLIVTSPPYPSNAIDYMRAHKFSLVWFGYSVTALSELRREYIGNEVIDESRFEPLPEQTETVIRAISQRDGRKARILRRYYSDMTRALREMFRVLKPGRAAVVVVGSSNMRGVDTAVHICLEEIGEKLGFEIPHIGIRRIDRDRRMLPVQRHKNNGSQIQQRMHEEHVIGFYRPAEG